MSTRVYVLWFVREGIEHKDAEIRIGVYSSEGQAKAAIERLRDKPGFADFPQGFEISAYELDHDHWVEGFKFSD